SYKKETDGEFFARMDRERIQREVERQRKKHMISLSISFVQDQRRMEVENMRREEQRIEDEMRRPAEILEESERKRAQEERSRRMKEDFEKMSRMQREATSRATTSSRKGVTEVK
ncbi:hypothetical protein PENTCL1PPCAC_224, partial [Pristionchus entomophagus]